MTTTHDTRYLTRHRCGRGFTYRYPDGCTLADRRLRRWIKSLAIPPAWRDVEITLERDARVHASGRDTAGRKQYIYNENWRAERDAAKFDRLLDFAHRLPTMRRATGQHLAREDHSRECVLACMVRLIDTAYFRPGSARYAAENASYGLTTMRSKHLSIEGDTLVFDYQGKSGKQQHREVADARLARIVAELDDLPGYEIFKYYDTNGQRIDVDSADLNDYIHDVMGDAFSAKDFRTWAGTSLAALALDEIGPGDDDNSRQKNVVAAVKRVAAHLGNTPAIARESYIHPQVITHYLDGRTLRHFAELVENERARDELAGPEERLVLAMLDERLSKAANEVSSC
ncbi:DNA topoisomerase IB [Salinisphaera sp. Q1T1-3]|uniref:DNA topoisomerase IB n=1 Tax=Salinisphaera sp. Q1T1-3 TaxID=2321229 RepID=UPI000E7686EA|nr:DNA topoisomerase IB [Salinisphaera sp. Q1T1-3]RJS93071.1 DNA topoisomerase IB [Salinisphaera sp. Q1T1-3]